MSSRERVVASTIRADVASSPSRHVPGAVPRRPTGGQERALRTVVSLLVALEVGRLDVVLPDGRRRTFGDPSSPLCTDLTVHDWGFFPALLHGGSVGVGEAYMDGQWSSGDLVTLLRLVIANRGAFRRLTPTALARVAADAAVHAARGNRATRSKHNVAAHYDLSNDLYGLFLDRSMTYSAAYFTAPSVTLEEAQEAKYRRLAERIELGEAKHVLEIGCGWGGFATLVAGTYGCRVTAVTLSEEQATYARARVQREGLGSLVDVRIQDYRAIRGSFDRVVSIEMLEAVGHRYLPSYFRAIDRALGPDGLAAIQVITIPEQRYAAYRRRPDFIQRHIFPGGHLPSLASMCRAMGRSSELYVHDVENVAPHYAETLRRWRGRFLRQRPAVLALGFDARFVRMWEFYLAYCEAAFLARYISDLQLVLTRPMNGTLGTQPYAGRLVPVTEAHIRRTALGDAEVVA